MHFYRPKRSWAKVMFLQASVILSTGGGVCLSACWDTTTTPKEQTHPPRSRCRHPPEQTAPPPRADTSPGSRHPPQEQMQTPLCSRHPPGSRPPWKQTFSQEADTPPEADSSIRSTSGRYTTYWNAFLF